MPPGLLESEKGAPGFAHPGGPQDLEKAKNRILAKGKAPTEHYAQSVPVRVDWPRKRVQALYLSEPWEGREAKPNSLLDYHFRKSWIIILERTVSCIKSFMGWRLGTWELVLE